MSRKPRRSPPGHARRRPERRPRRPAAPAKQPQRGGFGRVVRRLLGLFGLLILGGGLVGALALGVYMTQLNGVIQAKFEGKRWALPARVYARPLQLFPGAELNAEQFAAEIGLLPYRAGSNPNRPGTYSRRDNLFDVYTRSFTFWDGVEPSRKVRLRFGNKNLQAIEGLDAQAAPTLMRLEPVEIAGIYPAHGEDRVLVKFENIPPALIDTLMAVEDRSFYSHFGVDPKGITRAFLANLRAGRTVQGGSTLTQQLIKNFFLTSERSYKRKINEILMALLVEWHYDKHEILEAYANEAYLGQDGGRSVHGFGLASRFYFDRALTELDLHHIALLVGMVQAPSKYDPRRFPGQATQRRATVLDVMVDQHLISADDAVIAKQMPLDVTPKAPKGRGRYPAFLELVRRQLRQNYREEDLTSEGLKVFTTLDPDIQSRTEQALLSRLPKLDKKAGFKPGTLETAAVVADTQTGEIRAIVGARDVRLEGFNRALDAKRPAGSLLKPAVYLAALERPLDYTLATLLDDSALAFKAGNGQVWEPKNYDKRFHGQVMLMDSLVRSYNVATARLGLDLDAINVVKILKRLGLGGDIKPFPSLVLGAVDVSPYEIAQLYATFASGGYRLPLRAITEVTGVDGQPLPRLYSLSLEQAVKPGPSYLITRAMQRVAETGTAKSVAKLMPNMGIAGKTGTTDELRDSWFAGFSGNYLSVVWLGRDDNKPAKLTGATGALPLWIDIMKQLPSVPLALAEPSGIEWLLIDPLSGRLADTNCSGALKMPFMAGSAPMNWAPCSYYQTNSANTNGNANTTTQDSENMGSFFNRLLQ